MTWAGTVTMSVRELDRLEVGGRVAEQRLTQRQAAEQLGLSERQVRRLCRALGAQGANGLVSRKRGRPSNRKLPAAVRDEALALVRTRYADFGPTLAAEKLAEQHGMAVCVETLRRWMISHCSPRPVSTLGGARSSLCARWRWDQPRSLGSVTVPGVAMARRVASAR